MTKLTNIDTEFGKYYIANDFIIGSIIDVFGRRYVYEKT